MEIRSWYGCWRSSTEPGGTKCRPIRIRGVMAGVVRAVTSVALQEVVSNKCT